MTLTPTAQHGGIIQESAAVTMLTQAIKALASAVDDMPITEAASIKAQVATIQTATKELGMSKEAQELAAEAVRRSEWALGRAIRKGQSEGTVATHGGGRRSKTATPPLTSPSAFASKQELSGAGHGQPGIYELAESDPEVFDAAIDAAKAEGNLSRANVARKAREGSEKSDRAKPRKPLTDTARNAGWDLRKAVERIERIAADDRFGTNKEQVATHLRSHLTNAIEVCQTVLDRINESGEA